MSRISEEAEKLMEDLVKTHLKELRKLGIKINYTEEQLYNMGRLLAMTCVARNLKKFRFRKKRIEGFGYEWQLHELIRKEKQIQNYLKVNAIKDFKTKPKEF